jgi:hypothetical protein
LDDDDPRQAESYISKKPVFNTTGPRGHYDQSILDEAIPDGRNVDVLYEGKELNSDEMRGELWKDFEDR